MTLQAYIDDSADGDRSKVFTLAGYIAPTEAWFPFSEEWKKHLEDCRIESFKLKDMPLSRPEIIASFYRIIERHNIPLSVDCVLEIPVWQKVVSEIPWLPKAAFLKKLVSNPYFIVSKMLMRSLFTATRQMGYHEPIDLIFDDQIGEKKIVLEAWDYFKASMPSDLQKRMLNSPIFADDKQVMPLQAADLVAGYVRKSIEAGNDGNSAAVFPWTCMKTIQRLVMRFTEENLRNELQWVCSRENAEATIAFMKAEASK